MDDSKLIELVGQHPCLYDLKNQHYRDINVRDNIWADISEAMNQTADECKNRWKNLRDTFMRRKRNKKISTGSARSQKPRKWYLEESLIFLNRVENERAALTNTSRLEDTDNYNRDETSNSQTEDVEIEEATDNEINKQNSNLIYGNRKKKHVHSMKKPKVTNKIFEILEKNSQERKKLLSTFEKKAENELDVHPLLFFNNK